MDKVRSSSRVHGILQYILITIVVVQFCIILYLKGLSGNREINERTEPKHHIAKRSYFVAPTCPPGCRRVVKRPSRNRWVQRDQRSQLHSYLDHNGSTRQNSRKNVWESWPRGPPNGPPSTADGLQGVRGSEGQRGEPGTVGRHGVNGLPGTPGQRGQNGAPGSRGAQGFPGPRGPPGNFGPPGSPGMPGLPGTVGQPGPPGFAGEPGSPGTIGEHGPLGQRGQAGNPGLPGRRGYSGAPGLSGRSGGPWGAGTLRHSNDQGYRTRQISDYKPLRGDQGMPYEPNTPPTESKVAAKELKVAKALQTLKLYNNPNCIEDVNHHKVTQQLKEKGSVSFMILVDLAKNVFCILHS